MLKKLFAIIIVISLMMTGCNIAAPEDDKILSPKETVKEYFKS